MNRILVLAITAGGLMLLNSPEAAAHKEARGVHLPVAYYRVEHRRAKHMPYWLQKNKPFVRWYRHSSLKKARFVSWNQLFRIYQRERSYARRYIRDPYLHHHYRVQRMHASLRQLRAAGKRTHRH